MTRLIRTSGRALGALLLVVAVAACAPKPGIGVTDPHEARNREVFEANLAVDRAVFADSGRASPSTPSPVNRGISNFAANFALPGSIVNNVLQGRLDRVVQNTARFAINSTIGLGGLLDPASAINIPAAPTDFGETLYVWGVGEGNYVVLPILGPSTERHAVGRIVDVFTNPLLYVLPSPSNYAGLATGALATAGSRAQNAELLDDLIYGSADPYGQTRLYYLENRRFKLGQRSTAADGFGQGDFVDPYGELAAPAPAPITDFIDPYEDPYAQ
jgi:phospholipid-binding lipoprotein MlaA